MGLGLKAEEGGPSEGVADAPSGNGVKAAASSRGKRACGAVSENGGQVRRHPKRLPPSLHGPLRIKETRRRRRWQPGLGTVGMERQASLTDGAWGREGEGMQADGHVAFWNCASGRWGGKGAELRVAVPSLRWLEGDIPKKLLTGHQVAVLGPR